MSTANLETPAISEARCHHCNSTVKDKDAASGWCDSCGKRLPDSVRFQAKRKSPSWVSSSNPEGPVTVEKGINRGLQSFLLGLTLCFLFGMIALFIHHG